MALLDEIRRYVTEHGRAGVSNVADTPTVIVAEGHGNWSDNDQAMDRLKASVGVVQELMQDRRYRFFANESFLNAGPIRKAIREYWRRNQLPPPYDPNDPDNPNLTREQLGARIFTHGYKSLLGVLRAPPRYVLHIGSRQGGVARERRLAKHFVEELRDRGLTPKAPGVLLLGASHASAVPYYRDWPATTRMQLEDKGYKCVSVNVLTSFTHGTHADDAVVPIVGQSSDEIRLTGIAKNTLTLFTRHSTAKHQRSPFFSVKFTDSNSYRSVADQFEYLVLRNL